LSLTWKIASPRSHDTERPIVRLVAQNRPPSTKCFRAGEARNQGVKVLSKEVDRLLFIDDDCVLSPDTVAVHTDVNPRIILAGTRNHVDPEELSSRTLPAVYSSIYTLDNRLAHPENWGSYDSCYTCHLSISSAVFQRIGGFWEELTIGEDRDLCMRAMRAMCQVTFLPRDAVYHIDHEIRRPMGPQDLPEGAKLVEDSIKLPGYLRDSPL
jgi:hypothetical protein